MKQSNIGEDEVLVSQSGYTKVEGNKMLIYFNGDHQLLQESIRKGVATIYLNSMLFGSNLQDYLQNSVAIKLPPWFIDGFIAYAGSNWDILIDDEIRDIVSQRKFNYDFKKFSKNHPRAAGHAMWYYLKNEYGRSTILDLIYHVKITRDLDKSIEFVLGTKPKKLYENWATFFKNKYSAESNKFSIASNKELAVKNKKYNPISTLAASPDGRYLAYAVNTIGKIRLYLYDTLTRSHKKIDNRGFQNRFQEPYYNYPHIAWSPDGSEFTFTIQDKDKIYLKKHFLDGSKPIIQLLPDMYQAIYSIDYYKGNYYIINGEVNGMGDILLYDSESRASTAITSDFYNDLDARVTKLDGKEGILFTSNRTIEHTLPAELDTTLPLGETDVFFYELPEVLDKSALFNLPKTLVRLTNTPDYSERFPYILNNKVYYINAPSGIKNLYTSDLTSGEVSPMTNLSRNIIRHNLNSNDYYYTLYHEGRYKVYKTSLADLKPTKAEPTQYSTLFSNKSTVVRPSTIVKKNVIPDQLKFQSEYEDNANDLNLSEEIAKAQSKPTIVEEKKTIHQVGMPINNVLITAAGQKFRVDKLTAKMDNEVLFEGLEIVDGQNDQVAQLPMGFLMKAAFKDLFENYHIEVGARIPTSFTGGEYFMTMADNRKLIDRSFTLYQRSFNEKEFGDVVPAIVSRKKTLMGMYRLKLPLNLHHSIRGSGYLRLDNQFYKSTSDFTLQRTPINEKRIGVKVEYVYDNSFEKSPNILHGSRMKFYVEGMNEFNFELGGGNTKVDLSKSVTSVVGIDARHYIPLLNHSTIALRGVSAFSFGSKQNLYYLGGINNALFQNFEDNIPISQKQEFAFKTNAPNLRGFGNNIRNGSRFALANAEIRIPFMKYILGERGGGSFLGNLQLVAFGDAGLAWYGSSPYEADVNPLNTVELDEPLIDLQIQYFRDPLVFGYGYGLRTKLLGYFVKLDVGYGIETNRVFAPKYHIGVGKDF